MCRQRGLGKFEFAIVVAVIGVLAMLFLARIEVVQAEAERTQVDLTVRNIRVGIQLAVGELIMQGREEQMARLAAANPVSFLGKPPEGYEGEAGSPARAGGWSWDPVMRDIAYRPRLPSAFNGRAELRWRYQSTPGTAGRPGGLRLTPQ